MNGAATFLEFLDFKFLKNAQVEYVEVPMLQRDYAQGRKSQIDIAYKFLKALFEVLEGTKKTLHLDLVYGYEDGSVFKLIDGQQRVTTLWLLHFLLYKQAHRLEEIKGQLSHFTYHTRESSKEFCRKLLEEDFEWVQQPSEVISQYEGSFGDVSDLENDPTIKAMIHMLDLIYDHLKDKGASLDRYISRLPNISFDVINMEEFKLGEELYIKLNARGKLLSKFENLKAFMEQADIAYEWLLALDNHWSNYFFESDKAEAFDQRFFHFLHYANAFFALQDRDFDQDKYLDKIFSTDRSIDEGNWYRFLQEEKNLEVLGQTIDLLSKCKENAKNQEKYLELKLLTINDPSFFEAQGEKSKTPKNQEPKLENKKIAYFFALLALSQVYQEGVLDKDVKDYARVCKHFIENSFLYIADLRGFAGLFQAIAKGVTHKEGFHAFLANTKKQTFHGLFGLEQRKAQLICSDGAWENILDRTSNHAYLVGYVGFLLEFSKIDGQENLQKFTDYATLTMEILERFFLHPSEDYPFHLFQRVLLCFGNYSIKSTNHFFGNRFNIGMFRYRHLVFRLFEREPYKDQKYLKNYFHKLLDNLLKSPQTNLQDKMQGILQSYISQQGQGLLEISWQLTERDWWEQLLIQQEDLFDFINKEVGKECGRIYFVNDSELKKGYLLPVKRYSEKAFDLLGYALYCCLKRRIENLEPYENGRQVRQFVFNGFAIFANSQTSTIALEHIEDKRAPQHIPINLNSGQDVFKELQSVVDKIQEML
ncbi:GmrSD restriction endonuclease domain-containing protein [Helicobacter felis]|uniref:GmrSD restriction endonuclease domain-containing protein n=1 Tax=Helicobacter felis TaxID=214 RepID=UPI000CEEBCDC|nr:DUF262 domain-containing protein [Helicobacter felis]